MYNKDRLEQPIGMRITKIIDEAKDFRTFVIGEKFDALPGQFVMTWIPGVDMKPVAVAEIRSHEFEIGVLKRGPWSNKMFELKEGDMIGIQGPHGNSFDLRNKKTILMVGGGCGIPPLKFAAKEAEKQGIHVEMILGARTAELLAYENAFHDDKNVHVHLCTDDGSKGTKGFTTQILENLLKDTNSYDAVFTCGPEIMMKVVGDISEKYKVPCYLSLERYMKCGFGICGQCCVDGPGLRTCKEGPVFNWETVKTFKDFNTYHRDKKGSKVEI